MEDIRLLKNKINDLKREIHVIKVSLGYSSACYQRFHRTRIYNAYPLTLQSSATHVDNLKNEVYHLQRELLQERTKVKALSGELYRYDMI